MDDDLDRALLKEKIYAICTSAGDENNYVSRQHPGKYKTYSVFTTKSRAENVLSKTTGIVAVETYFHNVLIAANAAEGMAGVVINPMDNAVRLDFSPQDVAKWIANTYLKAKAVVDAEKIQSEPPADTAGFKPDPNLEFVAKQYSLDCRDYVSSKLAALDTKLDYSFKSVQVIEIFLGELHAELTSATPENIILFSKMFGSYLGESYRHTYGAEWGFDKGGQPALRTTGGIICYPWGRVHKRITNGEEDNVAVWFHYLLEKGSIGSLVSDKTSVRPPSLPDQTSS